MIDLCPLLIIHSSNEILELCVVFSDLLEIHASVCFFNYCFKVDARIWLIQCFEGFDC